MHRVNRIGLLCLTLATPSVFADAKAPYPEGYRDWHHVKSMVINPGHPLYGAFGGIHHLYANNKAVSGYKSGKFPDGAVIVFDLLETKDEGNAVTESTRKIVGVMHKNSKKYAATGGWGFEGFKGGARTDCYQCHTQQKDRDFVFSKLRD